MYFVPPCERPPAHLSPNVHGRWWTASQRLFGFYARGHEPLGRFVVKKRRHEGELLIHETQAVEHHGLDGGAHGHNTGLWILLRGLVNDRANPQLFEHLCNKTRVIQHFTAVGASIVVSSQEEILLAL